MVRSCGGDAADGTFATKAGAGIATSPFSVHAPAQLTLGSGGKELVYTYDTQGERTGITALLDDLARANIRFRDLQTTQSSLEDIFVDLVRERA